MSGDSITITCGKVFKPCKDVEDYPECHPENEQEGWVGLEEVVVCENEVVAEDGTKQTIQDFRLLVPGSEKPENCGKKRPPMFEDDEETRYTNENELYTLLMKKPEGNPDKNFLKKMGLEGVCRAPYMGDSGPLSWYAYVGNAGHAGYMTLYNKGNPSLFHDQNGIWLSYSEMMGLAKSEELNLQRVDVVCSSLPKLKREVVKGKDDSESVDRSYSPGRYHFKKDQHFLEHVISVLENEEIKIEGFEGDRRQWLLNRIEKVYDKETAQLKFLETTSWVQWLSAISAVLVSAYFGHMLFKMIKEKLMGRVVTTDYDKIVAERLKASPDYDIKGRDLEARTAWRMASKKSGYVNIMIDAPTGEGKDVIVEKMMIMKEQGDPVVPEQFRKAKVMKINAAEFQSGTQYRGNVADKVAEIARAARKGPVIFYMSEIDLVFLSGGTMSGDTESPGKLILDLVDDPAIKRNLLIIGTTSRGKKMLERYPDLQRRFNWPEVRLFSLETMIEVLDGPAVAQLAKEYEVKIFPEAVDAAARMGEAYYRPAQQGKTGAVPPRFAAVTAVLETAVQIAGEEKSPDLKLDHVIRATEELCAMSIDPQSTEVQEILKMPVRELEAKVAAELKAGQVDPFMAQLEGARAMMGGVGSGKVVEYKGFDPSKELPERVRQFMKTNGWDQYYYREQSITDGPFEKETLEMLKIMKNKGTGALEMMKLGVMWEEMPAKDRALFYDPASKAFAEGAPVELIRVINEGGVPIPQGPVSSAMGGENSQSSGISPIVKEMVEHPEYRDLQVWEMKERAEAINVFMKELRVAGELGRFYDKDAKVFLEGKFDLLAEASKKGSVATIADLTKAAEAVESAKTSGAKKSAAKEFAKEMAKKK